MSTQSTAELLSSLRELFTTGLYSDLRITCGDDEHNVHKAIVCPRSQPLSLMCNEVADDEETVLAMVDDDPQAMELMLHYLYTLDYPHVPPKALENGINGTHTEDTKSPNGHAPPAANLVYSIEKEEFEVVPPDEAVKPIDVETVQGAGVTSKKKKKKNKKNASASWASVSDDTAELLVEPLAAPPTVSSNLVVHAKLYALGCKYGIEGLKALAGEKFEREVEDHWESEDFLSAAREAYTSTGESCRTIRDAVLNAIKLHPELLGRKQVQDAIKGLELSFELLMHFHDSTPNVTQLKI